ncbi:RNA-directed RNA polymerase [ssRNA phage SRR7976326_2]|uniref:RNA-directed RNA polymerase n=1 Tax=ssRNA phage SRR7976326_2 TaxID=2786726 RepID=A0A8S5L1A7_9VIRU|nr:RNA-directed RNA polymerase [ssRNA phage SRR7976326_2]DAD51215.1 TPA_asm: RNA-directed RNA polymerase [ssRNA phage SRR7976326_2]
MISVTALFKAVKSDILGNYPDLANSAIEMMSGDANRVAAALLIENFTKKQVMELDEKRCNTTALTTFLKVNEAVGKQSQVPIFEWEAELMGCFNKAVYEFFNPNGMPLLHEWSEIVSHGDLGTGSNQLVTSTDFYSKMFASPLSVSHSDLYDIYRRAIDRNFKWSQAEETRLSQGYSVVVCDANKLGFVAKNDKTSRVIATEPTLNMFFQRGISNLIERRLGDYGVDLATQPDRNRELARRGSISGHLATIDLKSASDSIGKLVLEHIPKSQRSFLLKTRCSRTILPHNLGRLVGGSVRLEMLSTMGNGYTSSLQTAIFMCVILAAFDYARVKPSGNKGPDYLLNWGVFGDDIIVPTGRVLRYTMRILALLGFTVNSEKSFIEGPFRESCGGDFYRGVNVRPVHAKDWSTRESLFTTFNRVDWWCTKHFELLTLKRVLAKAIMRTGSVFLVPLHFPDDSGIQVSYRTAVRNLRKDLNGAIITRYRRAVSSGLAVVGAECSTQFVVTQDGELEDANSPGLLVACLRGSVKSVRNGVQKIPGRADCNRYATRVAHVPNWDSPVAHRETGYLPKGFLPRPLY